MQPSFLRPPPHPPTPSLVQPATSCSSSLPQTSTLIVVVLTDSRTCYIRLIEAYLNVLDFKLSQLVGRKLRSWTSDLASFLRLHSASDNGGLTKQNPLTINKVLFQWCIVHQEHDAAIAILI